MRPALGRRLSYWLVGLFAVVVPIVAWAHPVNIYRATLRIEPEGALLELHADEHTLSHEEALYRNPMDARYTMAAIASSIVLRAEDGERLRPDSITVSTNDDGTHTASVEYPIAEDPGVCSIASVPKGPLAQGRRRISLTITRDGSACRTIEVTSGRNHHALRLGGTPLDDPSRFVRPRITVRSLDPGKTLVDVDFPTTIAQEFITSHRTDESHDGDALLDAFNDWVKDSLHAGNATPVRTTAQRVDASDGPRDGAHPVNPHTLRFRVSLTFDERIESLRWRGFAGDINACDLYHARNDGRARRIGVLNRTSDRFALRTESETHP